MKKIACLLAVALIAATGFSASLSEGTKELGVAGEINRDTVAAAASLGYFVIDNLVVGLGAGGAYYDFGDRLEMTSYSGGVYAQYHFDLGSAFVPFIGAQANIAYAKVSQKYSSTDPSGAKVTTEVSSDETAFMGEGQVGVKMFVAENVAIAAYGFYDMSNKEIYSNKDEMEKKDFGLRVGMNTYF